MNHFHLSQPVGYPRHLDMNRHCSFPVKYTIVIIIQLKVNIPKYRLLWMDRDHVHEEADLMSTLDKRLVEAVKSHQDSLNQNMQ